MANTRLSGGRLSSTSLSPATRRKASGPVDTDVVYFGVSGEKGAHAVVRVDLGAKVLSVRDADKGQAQSVPFASLVRVRTEDKELLLQVELKGGGTLDFACYNEFDFEAIQRLLRKVIGSAADLMQFSNTLKPQLCFVQGVGFLKKTMKADSEIRFVLVERTAIIHPPEQESQPQYLFPLWKRPCFTVGKNGVRFELSKKKGVEVFFESEEVRDNYFNVIGIAAQKTPTMSVPLRLKLEMLVRLHTTPFEPHNPRHFEFAQRLWDATVARYDPSAGPMPESTESELWKVLGLSTTALALDLKVCNLLGLVCCVYFAENYASDFEELVQANRKGTGDCYAVFPNLARISYMFFTLLGLGKKQTSWYPTFVTYPMWNYDSEAFEVIVCIGLRLFHKKWLSSIAKNQQQCMNDLVADLTDTLSRPPSPDGVPYVFSMFSVLLARRADVKRNYFLPVDEELPSGRSGSQLVAGADVPMQRTLDPWCFTQKNFLTQYLAAEDERRALMLGAPFSTAVAEQKDLQQRRAEKKRLEIKWEAVKDVRNEFKSKHMCRVCQRRKNNTVVLPCLHLVVCREDYVEGMRCPQCKVYAVGFIEVLFEDKSLMTLK